MRLRCSSVAWSFVAVLSLCGGSGCSSSSDVGRVGESCSASSPCKGGLTCYQEGDGIYTKLNGICTRKDCNVRSGDSCRAVDADTSCVGGILICGRTCAAGCLEGTICDPTGKSYCTKY
jgi:hypothetical protein